MDAPTHAYASKALKVFQPGKPVKSSPGEPMKNFLGRGEHTGPERYWTGPGTNIAAIAAAAALFGFLASGCFLTKMGPFAQPAAPPYSSAANGAGTFVPLHISGAVATTPAANFQYVQIGRPTILSDEHN